MTDLLLIPLPYAAWAAKALLFALVAAILVADIRLFLSRRKTR